jgi:signal transduction histidine kinase
MDSALPEVARTEFAAAALQTAITAALALLCVFLYRRHGKPYFAWFAAAWGLYVLRMLAIGSFLVTGARGWLYAHQVVTGLTALALLWAALVFSRQLAWRWAYLVVALFPPLWSLVAIYRLENFGLAAGPMVAFLSLATGWAGAVFWRYHRRVGSPGALLLAGALGLWALHHLDYPFLRARGAWSPWGYYLDIAFELAVGGGIMLLVMDDLRRGLGALSALSGDLQRAPHLADPLGPLLARPLSLPAVRGTAFFTTAAGADGGPDGFACERGAGTCTAWTGTRPVGALALLLAGVRATGRPEVAQGVAGHPSIAVLPVSADAASPVSGALVLAGEARDPFTALDESFLRALGQQVGAALQSAALYRALEARRAELERLQARMLRQHEEERRRLSRELHDETAQVFSAVKMQLGVLRDAAPDGDGTGTGRDGGATQRARLDRVLALIDTGIRSIRGVTNALRPSLLDDLGLPAALRSLCADFGERTGIAVDLAAADPLPALGADADLALFRAVQEALSNVARHAGARHVRVAVGTAADGGVTLSCATTAAAWARPPTWPGGSATATWASWACGSGSPRSAGRCRSPTCRGAARSCAPACRDRPSRRPARTRAGGAGARGVVPRAPAPPAVVRPT